MWLFTDEKWTVLLWKCAVAGLGGLVVWRWKALCAGNGGWDYWYSSWALLSVFLTHFRHCYLRPEVLPLICQFPPTLHPSPRSWGAGEDAGGRRGAGHWCGVTGQKIQRGKLSCFHLGLKCELPKLLHPKWTYLTSKIRDTHAHTYLSLKLPWGAEQGGKARAWGI